MSSRSAYFTQLDAVRTLAVGMVMVSHWHTGHRFQFLHYGGAMGVGLFFVLSGFLITLILLRQQDAFQLGTSTDRFNILKTFYIRRTLRIFPIYYLYIGVLVVLGIGQAREIWPWLFGYAYNFLLYLSQNWYSGYIEHLWSLAIEEQYYLLWPALLLFCPKRYNLHLVLGFIALAVIVRAAMYLQAPASQYSKFPVTQFDGFGIGSLFALAWERGMRFRYAAFWFALCWGLSFFLKWNTFFQFKGMSFLGQVLPLFFLGCGFLVYMAACEIKGPAAWFFNQPFVLYLGKISYGLYLYHLCVPDLVKHFLKLAGLPTQHLAILWTLYIGTTLLISWLSWNLIEKPINRLKDHFTYKAVR
jgi:peptidoglycan/LPS O-acetylase OafA/YrhL